MLSIRCHYRRRGCAARTLMCVVLIAVLRVNIWWFRLLTPLSVPLGRLPSYEETPDSNGRYPDTYLRRIKQFLYKRNVSALAYEQMMDNDVQLIPEIKREIVRLRGIQVEQLMSIRNGEELRRGCEKSCCWSQKRMPDFFLGETGRLPTVLDRLSQIDIKLLADLHYGNLRTPDGIKLPKLTLDILPCLQNNTIIFVDTSDLRHFFRNFHEKIAVDYILITGDSDLPCPLFLSHTHAPLLDQIFSGKTRIRHWFSMNCHWGGNEAWRTSQMLTCIPQGISQWQDQRYYMHLASGKDDSVYNTHLKSDDYWMFTSFNKANGADRTKLWALSCLGRLQNISKCFYQLDSIDQWRYYLHIARSKFVLSPPGNGMDCYRTWEALYLGSVPIIVNRPINSIFQQLPVLVVDNYEDITVQFLNATYERMTRQSYDYKRLYKGYWQRQIHSFRNSSTILQIQYSSVKH